VTIAIILGWLAGAGLVAFVAGEKNRSPGGWALISLLFSPVLSLLALIAAGDGRAGGSSSSSSSSSTRSRPAINKRKCKKVDGKTLASDRSHCPHCGDTIDAGDSNHPRV